MRQKKATLTSAHWTTEQDALLCDYLKQHNDGNKKGTDVKAAVPALQAFEAPTLNTNIQSMHVKLSKSKSFDPRQDSQPINLSSFKSKQLVAGNSDDSDNKTILPAPHLAFPGMCRDSSQASAARPAVAQVTPFASTLHLHDLMTFMDEDTGLHHVQIILCIVTDHQIQYNVTADGKQLVYVLKPKTVAARDFVDPDHMNFDHPPNQAIVQYFHNDPGMEEFTYIINLPEPVDSNCIDMRNVLWTAETKDMSGKMVQI
ncbi:hypothetical protein HDU80_011173 [Chytriomyces hyalinus]|nr:hypothetical protein HDU80_011173 [Chytriomyces hyalinus]